MAQKTTVEFQDINLKTGSMSYWAGSDADALVILETARGLSNAMVLKADTSFPVDITGLSSNDAVKANISTVKAKGKLHLTGYNANSNGQRNDSVKLSVPAPVGGVFIGDQADVANADLQGLKAVVLSVRGVPMDTVKSYKLGK